MDAKKFVALLIGKSPGGCSRLSNRLGRRGCNCWCATSKQEGCLLLDNHSFDFVLGPIRLNGDSLYPLIGQLGGSGTTLFYSQAVEDGCWWLPALRRGANCFGAPALRPIEFVAALDGIIQEIRVGTLVAAKSQSPLAFRIAAPLAVAALPRRIGIGALPK